MKNDIPFNVLRNPNAWENAPRDPISAAIATAVTGATAGAAYWAVYALSSIAISAVTGAILGGPQIPSLDLTSAGVNSSSGLLVNQRGSTEAMDFVYGEVRKGGTVTFIETTGTNNKILHQIICLAGHEIEEVSDIYFNDEVVTMSGPTVTSAPYANNASVYVHLGDQTSATSTFANSTASLATTLHAETSATSGFVGKGIAYLYCRLTYDQDAFANGLPTITAKIKGKKIVTTSSGTEQTATYTNNAAWCIRDFLVSEYGLNDDAIDYSSFEAAADICDDHLDGTSIDQYTINGVVRSSQSFGNVLENMMTACAGTLYWGAGKWRLYVGNFVTPTKTLTLGDLRGPISLDTRQSMRDNFNTVRGTYIDADNDFISTDYPEVTNGAFLTEDDSVEVVSELALPFTTNSKAAQRLAKQFLYRGREQMTLQAEFGMAAFDVEVGDFVKVQNARYGWGSGDEKTFECTGWQLAANSDGGDLRVKLTLRESSSEAFGWSESDAVTIVNNNTTLRKFYDVPPIGLSISQDYRVVNENVTNALVIEVTCASPEQIDYVILKYKKTSDTDFKTIGQGLLIDGNNDIARFEVNDIETPQLGGSAINYTIVATPVNALGVKGTSQTTTFNVTADTTPPSAPSSLSHALSGGTAFFSWPSVSDLDLSHYKLYYSSNSSANFGDASVLQKVEKIARPATSITQPALSGKFFISAIDKTGNESTTAASTTISASELPSLGQSETDDEHTTFSGSKSNLTVSSGNLYMTSYSTAGSTGTYDFDHDSVGYMDVGTSRTVRVSTAITVSRKHQDAVSGEVNWDDIPDNWDTWPDNWDTWTDEDADFADYAVQLQARAANTTGGLSSATFVDASGELVGRYIEFRAILSNTNAKISPNITALSATVEY